MQKHRRVRTVTGVSLLIVLLLASITTGLAAPVHPQATQFATIALPPEARALSIALPAGKPASPKLDAALARLASAQEDGAIDVAAVAQQAGLRVADDRVHVQIAIHAGRRDQVAAAVGVIGGEVTGVGDGGTLIQGWLPIGALREIAAQPGILRIRQPEKVTLLEGNATSEGLAPGNVPAWHIAGYRGAGVKIGIIDGGFMGYHSLLGSDLPATVTVKNFVDGETEAQVDGTTRHGTACAEIIYDSAPAAQLFLAKIQTHIDLAEAVAWLKDTQHVDIISTSIGWYTLAPGDGTGFFADLVEQARAAGILWVTAAGNDREAHWGGRFSDPDADSAHNFNGAQEINYFGPGNGDAFSIPAGYLVRGYLRWDDWTAVNQDYDLLLVRWNGIGWVIVAAGANTQNGSAGQTPTEFVAAVTSGPPTAYGFVIVRYSSTRNVHLEFFAPGIERLDEMVPERSLSNLADSPGAMTVAAVGVDAPYAQESYSSEGPTNGPGGTESGGARKPDIAAYAGVSTQSYGPRAFYGTSAATPHVAGAAALALSARPGDTVAQIRSFLETRAVDLGPAGKDTQFGHGRLSLGAPPTPPAISIADVTAVEGQDGTTSANFTVSLSAASTSEVTVSYATTDGTAIAGSDYLSKTGVLSFPAGTTTRIIEVPIKGDRQDEANENFLVNLTSPANATIADGQAVGTIVDDDDPLPQYTIYLPIIRR